MYSVYTNKKTKILFYYESLYNRYWKNILNVKCKLFISTSKN